MQKVILKFGVAPMMLLLLFVSVAGAKDYQIEVVMFENLGGRSSSGIPSLYVPRINRAIGLSSEKAQAAGFALVEDGLALTEQAESIKKSGQYRLLRHFAWRQPGLDAESAQAIRVNIGKGLKVYIPEDFKQYKEFIPASAVPLGESGSRELTTTTVNGILKIRLGRFLHLDSRLVFTDDKSAVSYRLEHSRKMRSRELHYIDNPRFGMLVRILPIEE